MALIVTAGLTTGNVKIIINNYLVSWLDACWFYLGFMLSLPRSSSDPKRSFQTCQLVSQPGRRCLGLLSEQAASLSQSNSITLNIYSSSFLRTLAELQS